MENIIDISLIFSSIWIVLVPPSEVHTKQPLRFVSYFYLWDCFGIVINYKRPKVENVSHLSWMHQKRDEHGNWIKNKMD